MLDEFVFKEITDEKYNYSFGYYTENKWLDEKSLVLIRGNTPSISTDKATDSYAELIIYNVENGEVCIVADGVSSFTDFLVHGNTVYYVKNSALLSYNSDNGETKELVSKKGIGNVHINSDGRFISAFCCDRSVSSHYIVNTETGVTELLFEKTFPEPYPFANHGMVSPTDENIYFFAHEGDTKNIFDRMWIYDRRKKEMRNIAKQRVDDNGYPIDCIGHECFAHDGCGLYFVRYHESRSENGICYADVYGSCMRLLYTGYDYWHVGASESGNYLTADTRNLGGDKSGVVIIDLKSGEEKLIDAPRVTFKHPCHPHPQLSPDDKRLIYHFVSDSGMIGVKIVYL